MILYGIPTCDTCRKARKALEEAGHAVIFRDVRADSLTPADLSRFLEVFGDRLVNRSSTTWRGLSDAERAADPAGLLAAHPTLIKRPVIEAPEQAGSPITLGWDKAAQAVWL